MMASPSELSLDCKPQSYSMLLKSFSDHNPSEQATQKLEEYLNRLEEERLKIDAFKRELPLCMQLLTNAMEASRQQLQSYRANQLGPRPVLEEFIPLKSPNSEGTDQKPAAISADKANWMTSAQLWSQTGEGGNKQLPPSPMPKAEAEAGFSASPRLALDNRHRNGAFLPFSKERGSGFQENPSSRPLPDLALASREREVGDNKGSQSEDGNRVVENSSKEGNGVAGKPADSQTTTTSNTTASTTTTTSQQQAHRKARRCWSPDLHRRFVSALQMLGGSQVATPKQIRELMKVDGLTNDEVKSHLQKYRLHTRRPSPSPQAAGAPAAQLVVLGGIWVPPEYAAAAHGHGGGPAIYGAHPSSQVSPHYCSPAAMPQEFYPPPPPPPPPPQSHPQLLHQQHHHQIHVYRTSSHTQTHSSPESDARGAGDRSESIEDGKSDSSSWKAGESGGDNGGERNRLAILRDNGEESHGSEITLKF